MCARFKDKQQCQDESITVSEPLQTFIWSDPQPSKVEWSKYDHEFTPSPYGRFRNPYTKIIPGRSRFWPAQPPLSHYQTVAYSLNIHKVLFSLVYGKIPQLNLSGKVGKLVVFLADLVFYADYYDLLGAVRFPIEEWARSIPSVWMDIRDHSGFWIGLSRLLRSEDLFRDAMKHCVGRYNFHCFSGAQYNIPEEVYDLAKKIEHETEFQQTLLCKKLIQVVMHPNDRLPCCDYTVKKPYDPSEHNYFTRVREVVQGRFYFWFTGVLGFDRDKCTSFRFLYDCAKRNDFGSLLKYDSVFDLARTYDMQIEHIQNCAAEFFRWMILHFDRSPLFGGHQGPPSHRYDQSGDSATCVEPCTCYKAKCDGENYFTIMSPGTELPEAIWGPNPSLPPPKCVGTSPATTEYQKACGIDFGSQLVGEDWEWIRHLTTSIFD